MDWVTRMNKIRDRADSIDRGGVKRGIALAEQEVAGYLTMGEPVDYAVSVRNMLSRKLLVAVCHKYGVKVLRFAKQKETTVVVRTTAHFLNAVLWAEYTQYEALFQELVKDVADMVAGNIYAGDPIEEEILEGEAPEDIENEMF